MHEWVAPINRTSTLRCSSTNPILDSHQLRVASGIQPSTLKASGTVSGPKKTTIENVSAAEVHGDNAGVRIREPKDDTSWIPICRSPHPLLIIKSR